MPSTGTAKTVGFRSLLIALTCVGLSACPFSAQDADAVKIHKKVFSNGLTALVIEDHAAPVISYQTWFKVGSVDEQPGMTGLAHLFEHLMFKGTVHFPGREFFKRLESKGAEVNAYTTRDTTVFYQNFVPELLDTVIELESDRLGGVELTQELLDTERMIVLEERRLRLEGNPEGRMQEAVWNRAFSHHPYSWPVIGYPQDILTLTLDQARAFYEAFYHPANATLVVVGDVDAETLFQKVQKAYGAIEPRPLRKRTVYQEPEQREERRLVLHDEQAISDRVAIAYPIPSAHDEDSYALDVLANILFEGESSRGNRLLVEDKELALGVGGTAYTPDQPGLFLITATLRAKVATSKVEDAIDGLFRSVAEKGVTADEVHAAVRQLTVQLVDSVRTPYGLGQFVGTVQAIFGNPNRLMEDLQRYSKITPSDVQDVAKKFFLPNHRTVVVMTR